MKIISDYGKFGTLKSLLQVSGRSRDRPPLVTRRGRVTAWSRPKPKVGCLRVDFLSAGRRAGGAAGRSRTNHSLCSRQLGL